MQSNWSTVFWSITQQINLFPDMPLQRIITRTNLEKLVSRKSNDKVSWKFEKAHVLCILQFGIICHIINHKNTCGSTLIFEKVVDSFLKTNTASQIIQIVSNLKQDTFSGCFNLFPQVSCKLKYFQICIFNERWKHHYYFYLTPIPESPNIPYFFNTCLILASPKIQRKKEKQWSL